MSQVDQLKQAIENISQKQQVISKEAKYATEQFDFHTQKQTTLKKEVQLEKTLDNFNESIAILMNVFAKSRFDEVMGMVANPFRLILLNFFIAFFRGIGFVCGALVVVYFINYLAGNVGNGLF